MDILPDYDIPGAYQRAWGNSPSEIDDAIDDIAKAEKEAKDMLTLALRAHPERTSSDISRRWNVIIGCLVLIRSKYPLLASNDLKNSLAMALDYIDAANIDYDNSDVADQAFAQAIGDYAFILTSSLEGEL